MEKDGQTTLVNALKSPQFAARVKRGRLFEQLGGGGVVRKLARIILTPSLYLPYVYYAKSPFGSGKFFLTTTFWGRAVRIPLRDYDALALHMFGFAGGNEAELRLTKFIAKNLDSEDVFYDVGANCGFYTYLASTVCKEVHTFEPIPLLAGTVRGNVHESDHVTVNEAVLSDTNGSVDFYVIGSSGLSTMSSEVAEGHKAAQGAARTITVPSMTLDEYVKTHAKPTFIKLDAEGAEEQIIEGGKDFFNTSAPLVTLEIWGKENEWERSMKAAERLRAMGYRSYRMDKEGDLDEAVGDLSAEIQPNGGDNFIFKK